MQGLDLTVFRWINGWPEWMNPFFQFFSEGNKWWWVRIVLLLFLITIIWIKKTRLAAIASMVAWPLANAFCDALKASLQMPRPSVELAEAPFDVNFRVEMLTSYGTASAHSANMASIAAVLWFADRRLGIVWTLIAFFTGLSRIYVGVHYPYQVLFGWIVGALVGITVWATFQSYLNLRRPKETPQTAQTQESDP